MKIICIQVNNKMIEYNIQSNNIIKELNNLDNTNNIDLLYTWNYDREYIIE